MISIHTMGAIPYKTFIGLERSIFPDGSLTLQTYNVMKEHEGFIGLFLNSNLIGYLFMKPYDCWWHIKKWE